MNHLCLRSFTIILSITIFSFSLSARQWPDEPDNVSGGFGAPREGSFSQGVYFLSKGERIRPWSDGEIIWKSEPSGGAEGLVVLEHPGGFRSGYRGMEGRPDLGTSIRDDAWLGYSSSEEWSFFITDTERSRIVDPITLLPARNEQTSPQWSTVELFRDSETLDIGNGISVASGQWSLAIDSSLFDVKGAIPAEISLYWVGERVGNLRFDALVEGENSVKMEAPDPRSYDEIYDSDGRLIFRDFLLNAGKGTLELRIRDETGRVVSRAWSLTVRN